MLVVVYTDLSGKELHRQTWVISGSLGGVMVSRVARTARDVALVFALDIKFPIFITPMTLVP